MKLSNCDRFAFWFWIIALATLAMVTYFMNS